MSLAALFVNSQKMDTTLMCLKQRLYIENMGSLTQWYSTQQLKRENIIKFSGKWKEVEKKIILIKATQTKKDKHNMYLLVVVISCSGKDCHTTVHSPENLKGRVLRETHETPWEGKIE